MQFGTYTAPEPPEAGDSYKPSEHVGHVIIAKVSAYKTGLTTKYKPNGDGVGVVLDICDLTEKGEVYRDVLWMNGALVDGLKDYAGKAPMVVSLANRTAGNGNTYIVVEPATEKQLKGAQDWVNKNGDPFAPVLATTGGSGVADDDEPPF